MDYEKIVCWNELVPPDLKFTAEATVEECINRHLTYVDKNFDSDADILRDFMTTHWAWFKEECADD